MGNGGNIFYLSVFKYNVNVYGETYKEVDQHFLESL